MSKRTQLNKKIEAARTGATKRRHRAFKEKHGIVLPKMATSIRRVK